MKRFSPRTVNQAVYGTSFCTRYVSHSARYATQSTGRLTDRHSMNLLVLETTHTVGNTTKVLLLVYTL